MNILAFLAFCIVVTFTPGPANVAIPATALFLSYCAWAVLDIPSLA